MTAIQFDSFIRMVAKGAAINFARDRCVQPIFICVDEGGNWTISEMGGIWGNDSASKDVVFAAARAIATEKKAVRCAFVSEAWALDAKEVGRDAVNLYLALGSLAQAPGRHELVQINAEDRTEGQRTGMMEIVRPEGLEPYLLKLRIEQYDMSEGRGVGLLPVMGPVS
jgi:hypothetical protein